MRFATYRPFILYGHAIIPYFLTCQIQHIIPGDCISTADHFRLSEQFRIAGHFRKLRDFIEQRLYIVLLNGSIRKIASSMKFSSGFTLFRIPTTIPPPSTCEATAPLFKGWQLFVQLFGFPHFQKLRGSVEADGLC